MVKLVRFNYLRVCRRCNKEYRGSKFSEVCKNCYDVARNWRKRKDISKRYKIKMMINSIELSAKNKTDARKQAIDLICKDLKDKWCLQVEVLKW